MLESWRNSKFTNWKYCH